jgi:hypothetical protein
MKKQEMQGGIQALKVSRRAPPISHLLFADDNLLFFRADAEQGTKVKMVLKEVERGIGQLIIPTKCSILFAGNCARDTTDVVQYILQVDRETFELSTLACPAQKVE